MSTFWRCGGLADKGTNPRNLVYVFEGDAHGEKRKEGVIPGLAALTIYLVPGNVMRQTL
jgi:hypothetical protein